MRRFPIAAAALLAAALVALAAPVAGDHGGAVCAPPDAVAAVLAAEYGELPAAIAAGAAGQQWTLYLSQAGAWSLVVLDPGAGLACIAVAGDGWGPAGPRPAPAPGGRRS